MKKEAIPARLTTTSSAVVPIARFSTLTEIFAAPIILTLPTDPIVIPCAAETLDIALSALFIPDDRPSAASSPCCTNPL